MVDINVIREEYFLDEILAALPKQVSKPTPDVRGKNLKKIFLQFSDSLKDIRLQYTCIDASSIAIAVGTNVGNAYIFERTSRKIKKISSETKYIPTTCIKLAPGCPNVAFGHESGTFSVGLVDPPIHQSFDSLTAQDIHHSSITSLEWSSDSLILYAGDNSGNISMSVVKISEGILQTAVILTEDCSVVQLAYAEDSLAISTMKRTVLWSFQTENLVQVGERERKTSGGFGCCIIPDNLQEPTKKLYAARPGLRVWTVDARGTVSSTSEFKSLLAEKPAVIQTLIKNDDKANSGGQFGKLLCYHDQYVTTWDQNHIWVLDLDAGSVTGCHSNLGHIRDVAVSGHEIYVLVNQRDRFLRRFVLMTERVLDSSSLDAVMAKDNADASKTPENSDKSGCDLSSALMTVPFMTLERDENSSPSPDGCSADVAGASEVPEKDLFDKIAAISFDDQPQDIVFTAEKPKKKKKKKQKQPAVSKNVGEDLSETPSESPVLSKQETKEHIQTSIVTENVKVDTISNLETTSPQMKSSEGLPTIKNDVEGKTRDTASIRKAEIRESRVEMPAERNEIADEGTSISMEDHLSNEANNVEPKTTEILRESVVSQISEISLTQVTSESIPEKQETPMLPETVSGGLTEQCITKKETSPTEPEISNLQDLSTPTVTSQQDTPYSSDIYGSSHETSRFVSVKDEQSESCENKAGNSDLKKEDHIPLFADTWSGRSLPTTQTIEDLSISQRYIFCVDYKNRVYFSDPTSDSGAGWETADFKAKRLYVNFQCDFICYLEQGKAFVRGGIDKDRPVGNTSYQILNEVSQLATCPTCTWAVTSAGLQRAETASLMKLKGDLKSSSMWKHEESISSSSQIICYDNVLWVRTHSETLQVFSVGRSGGKKSWKNEDKKAKWLSMSDDGAVWIITPDDQIWFQRRDEEVWYQVTLGQYIIDDPSILGSTVNFFYSVGSAFRNARATEYLRHAAKGLLQSTKAMAFSLFTDGGSPKQIHCNTQNGVWLLDTKNALHVCRSQATGAYWELVCPTGTAKSATWRDVTCGLAGYVWVIQPNGDFTCFHPDGPAYNVVNPMSEESVDFVSGSRLGLWCFNTIKNSKLYLRDGITESYPQGFAWTSLSLRHQDIKGIRHLSVGDITVWAVDIDGHVWIRVGSVNGDKPTVLAQAWLSLSCPQNVELASVEVNARDSMVWAVDTKGRVYAREGITKNLLVGTEWREVEGVILKSVCLSSYLVYGLCTTGEILCRFGVSPENCVGDYWKKIPGNFPRISVNTAGELWGLSTENKLFVRKMKFLKFSSDTAGEPGEVGEGVAKKDSHGDEKDGDWEVL